MSNEIHPFKFMFGLEFDHLPILEYPSELNHDENIIDITEQDKAGP